MFEKMVKGAQNLGKEGENIEKCRRDGVEIFSTAVEIIAKKFINRKVIIWVYNLG